MYNQKKLNNLLNPCKMNHHLYFELLIAFLIEESIMENYQTNFLAIISFPMDFLNKVSLFLLEKYLMLLHLIKNMHDFLLNLFLQNLDYLHFYLHKKIKYIFLKQQIKTC